MLAVALTAVGAPGTVPETTPLEAAEAELVPELLVAVTVKVYVVPFVSPPTVIGLLAPVAVFPPGLEVMV